MSFEFQAKLLGQELLGFGQPNLIECLSKDRWIENFCLTLRTSPICDERSRSAR